MTMSWSPCAVTPPASPPQAGCARGLRLPTLVVELHLGAQLVTIPSTGWRGDATQLLEWAGVVIGQHAPRLPPDAQGPCLPSPR
jgi:hypothetical protein